MDPPFDLMVGIEERDIETARQVPPDGGLTAAGEADQGNRIWLQLEISVLVTAVDSSIAV